jgi:tetratricopeptide (TPR) repeat protein
MAYALLGEIERARGLAEQAVALGPRDIEALIVQGTVLTLAGEHGAGSALIEQATRAEPRLPPGFRSSLGESRYLGRDYAGALRALEPMIDPPGYVYLLRAACLAQLGQIDLATKAVEAAIQVSSKSFDPVAFARNCAAYYALSRDVEHWLDGFRKAGIPV